MRHQGVPLDSEICSTASDLKTGALCGVFPCLTYRRVSSGARENSGLDLLLFLRDGDAIPGGVDPDRIIVDEELR